MVLATFLTRKLVINDQDLLMWSMLHEMSGYNMIFFLMTISIKLIKFISSVLTVLSLLNFFNCQLSYCPRYPINNVVLFCMFFPYYKIECTLVVFSCFFLFILILVNLLLFFAKRCLFMKHLQISNIFLWGTYTVYCIVSYKKAGFHLYRYFFTEIFNIVISLWTMVSFFSPRIPLNLCTVFTQILLEFYCRKRHSVVNALRQSRTSLSHKTIIIEIFVDDKKDKNYFCQTNKKKNVI